MITFDSFSEMEKDWGVIKIVREFPSRNWKMTFKKDYC